MQPWEVPLVQRSARSLVLNSLCLPDSASEPEMSRFLMLWELPMDDLTPRATELLRTWAPSSVWAPKTPLAMAISTSSCATTRLALY